MYSPDPTKHNLRACWNAAEIQLINNGTVPELYEQFRNQFTPALKTLLG